MKSDTTACYIDFSWMYAKCKFNFLYNFLYSADLMRLVQKFTSGCKKKKERFYSKYLCSLWFFPGRKFFNLSIMNVMTRWLEFAFFPKVSYLFIIIYNYDKVKSIALNNMLSLKMSISVKTLCHIIDDKSQHFLSILHKTKENICLSRSLWTETRSPDQQRAQDKKDRW